MTGPAVLRYRQRLPEVDALLITPDSISLAITWLRAYGRDGFLIGDALRVVPGPHDQAGLDVPHGHYLIRDVGTGRWAPCPRHQLAVEYHPIPGPPPHRPWEQRFGTGAAPAPAPYDLRRIADADPNATPPPRPGQPGGGL